MTKYWYTPYEMEKIHGEWRSVRRTIERNPIRKEYRRWDEVFCTEGYTMTQEQKDAMYNEVYRPIVEWEEQIQKSNKEIMERVKEKVSGSLYWGIRQYMKDLMANCYHVGQMEYKIVDKPQGKYQTEEWSKDLQGVWVDQRSVGYEGDSYEGNVYIKIGKNRYLTVNYSM